MIKTAEQYAMEGLVTIVDNLEFREQVIEVANVLYEYIKNHDHKDRFFDACHIRFEYLYSLFPEVTERFKEYRGDK